jgi:hypothetical protein
LLDDGDIRPSSRDQLIGKVRSDDAGTDDDNAL